MEIKNCVRHIAAVQAAQFLLRGRNEQGDICKILGEVVYVLIEYYAVSPTLFGKAERKKT